MIKTKKFRERARVVFTLCYKMAASSGGFTTKKLAKRGGGRKPAKESNDHCRICKCCFAIVGAPKCSTENLFLPSGRRECVGSVLSDILSAIDVNLKLEKEPGKSDRVFRACARKTRIAAEHIAFIRSHLAEDTSSHENPPSQVLLKSPVTTSSPRREKRSLPTTIFVLACIQTSANAYRIYRNGWCIYLEMHIPIPRLHKEKGTWQDYQIARWARDLSTHKTCRL